jgi:hypothetical protein
MSFLMLARFCSGLWIAKAEPKCDSIFDYLLQQKQIKLPCGHVIPSSEQLKKYMYCKWHNSYSHATNDVMFFVDRFNQP